jgi:hypothetical protein
MGRPRGSYRKLRVSKTKGLRFKAYSDMPCSEGGVVSGISDQYGRIVVQFQNSKGEMDIKPTGQCIAARH